MAFINADVLAKQLFPDEAEARSYEAAKIAETMRLNLLSEGRSFCFETVFSHPSKIDFIAKAKALGYEIILVYIHTETSSRKELSLSDKAKTRGKREFTGVNDRLSTFLTPYESERTFVQRSRAALNLARISQRVSEGGHHVPDDKVISRIPRVMQNIKQALPLFDVSYILDNSRLDNPFQKVAVIKGGKIAFSKKPLPTWATPLLSDYLE